jgi:hypothetical protein
MARITTERLREMRNAELVFQKWPALQDRVRRRSEELAEALGELLEYRDAEEQGERLLEFAPLPENCTLIQGASAFIVGDLLNEGTPNTRYPASSEEKKRGIFSHD